MPFSSGPNEIPASSPTCRQPDTCSPPPSPPTQIPPVPPSHLAPQISVLFRNRVAVRLGRQPTLLRGQCDLLAVLIGPRHKVNLLTQQPLQGRTQGGRGTAAVVALRSSLFKSIEGNCKHREQNPAISARGGVGGSRDCAQFSAFPTQPLPALTLPSHLEPSHCICCDGRIRGAHVRSCGGHAGMQNL